MAVPRMTKVFESVFHGQVYEINGVGYDVPELTYWCHENLDPEQIPLDQLIMSKSDEKHGSKEFKKHAKKVDHKKFPIVVVRRRDGTLQIADGNHRAYKAMSHGEKTIEGYVVPEESLPPSAIAQEEEDE